MNVIPSSILTFDFKAVAKQRPRFSRRSGRPYTPEETRTFEAMVGRLAKAQFPYAPIDRDQGGIKLEMTFYFKKAKTNKSKEHLQKPDCTNLAKAVEDALNGIVFIDDSQVTTLIVKKRWGLKDFFSVEVSKDI